MVLTAGGFDDISKVAWDLYLDCFTMASGAPQEFRLLVEELKTLHAMMKSFEGEFKNPDSMLVRAGEDCQKLIANMLAELNESLKTLNRIFCKNPSITGQFGGNHTWEKYKWASDGKQVYETRSKV